MKKQMKKVLKGFWVFIKLELLGFLLYGAIGGFCSCCLLLRPVSVYKKNKNNYKQENFMPTDYDMTWNIFDNFIGDRKKKIIARLVQELGFKEKGNSTEV